MQNRATIPVDLKSKKPVTKAFTALEATVMLVILFIITMLVIAIFIKNPTVELHPSKSSHETGKAESTAKKTSP